MIFFVKNSRTAEKILKLYEAKWMLVIATVFYCFSWFLYRICEGSTEIVELVTWWYYFWTTGSSTGYGDFSPTHWVTRLYAPIFYLGSFLIFLGFLSKVPVGFLKLVQSWKEGKMDNTEENSIVMFCNDATIINKLAQKLAMDIGRKDRKLVVVGDHKTDPLGELKDLRHQLIRESDPASLETYERSLMSRADRIVIYADEDNASLYAINQILDMGTDARLAVVLRDIDKQIGLKKTHNEVECLLAGSVDSVVQAIQDPGAVTNIMSLMDNKEEQKVYQTHMPSKETVSIETLRANLAHRGYMLLSHNGVLNPDPKVTVQHDDSLGLIGPERPQETLFQ